MYKEKEMTLSQKQWVAEQEAITRQENLTSAIEELTATINELNRSFYGVSIADALVNLTEELKEFNKKQNNGTFN